MLVFLCTRFLSKDLLPDIGIVFNTGPGLNSQINIDMETEIGSYLG